MTAIILLQNQTEDAVGVAKSFSPGLYHVAATGTFDGSSIKFHVQCEGELDGEGEDVYYPLFKNGEVYTITAPSIDQDLVMYVPGKIKAEVINAGASTDVTVKLFYDSHAIRRGNF